MATALGFAVGIGSYFLQADPAPALAIWALCALSLLGLLLRRLPWPMAALMLGFCWAHLWACTLLCGELPSELVRQDVKVEGRIASLPDSNALRTRFQFEVDRLVADGAQTPFSGRVRLSWYRGAPPLLAGERWRLRVRLKSPHGFANPGGFDYERWLFRQQIKATGYVRDPDTAQRLDTGTEPYWLDRWRQRLRDALHQALPGGVGAALIPALVIGDRGGLTPAQWSVFSRTGTSHLIAISGLHVGLISGVAFVLVRWLWSLFPGVALAVAAPRAGAVGALIAALCYAALAGFSVSTQRALVMLCVVLFAVIAGRTIRPASGLAVALMAVLLVDPGAVLDYGFWLSFGAVTALIFALARRLGRPGLIARWSAAQWAVAIGLLPLLIAFFGRASLIAPLVNLLAVPLFGLLLPLVLGGTLVYLLSGWALPLAAVDWLLTLGYNGLSWSAQLPWASIGLGQRPGWAWALAVLATLLLLAPRGLPGRWLGLPLLLPLWLLRPVPPEPGALEVTLLDVGQGLAAVLQTHRHTLVYDTGPAFSSGFNTGDAVLAPFLRARGIGSIDALVVSHADQDHAGGVDGLLASIPADRILSGEPGELNLRTAESCRRGQHWTWDGVRFSFLHPTDASESGNNSSCVLRVQIGSTVLLWPGDAEASVEQRLLQETAEQLPSEVLIAAHHGSDTSTTRDFLEVVAPDWVLYSAGWMNRFGFPSHAVRGRVQNAGAESLSTATSGAIRFRVAPDGTLGAFHRFRQASDRLWRHQPNRQTTEAGP